MAKPNNSIAKIKLPGENTQRPIVPYGLTDGTYYITLPSLNNDNGKIAVSSLDNNFTTTQTINGIRANSSELTIWANDNIDAGNDVDVVSFAVDYDDNDNYVGTRVTAIGHFTAFGDNDDANTNKPADETSFDDLDTDYFNTGITLRGDETYKLSFPAKSGVFATTDDCQLVEIVDLTQINS